MTLASAIIIVVLLLGEFFDYRAIRVESSLVVDSGRKEKMAIEFDISFPKIPCYSKGFFFLVYCLCAKEGISTDIIHSWTNSLNAGRDGCCW